MSCKQICNFTELQLYDYSLFRRDFSGRKLGRGNWGFCLPPPVPGFCALMIRLCFPCYLAADGDSHLSTYKCCDLENKHFCEYKLRLQFVCVCYSSLVSIIQKNQFARNKITVCPAVKPPLLAQIVPHANFMLVYHLQPTASIRKYLSFNARRKTAYSDLDSNSSTKHSDG